MTSSLIVEKRNHASYPKKSETAFKALAPQKPGAEATGSAPRQCSDLNKSG
jgi:hypothetical protein